MNSENLLRTAQKTLRDAAAEAYENANKYDLGGCVVEYRKCMIGEDACGAGFSKCVVNKAVLSEKASTTPIDTGVATIEIELTTLNEVTAKKIHCESVLDQCQKVKDRVWNEFLKSVASELKSAEFAAEDDQRRNCAKNIVSCIREVAQGEGYKEGTDSWAIFTGNFKNFEETCKDPIRQCESYSGELADGIKNYIKSALDALRADRCTTAIKTCLESENACHEDYSNCVGVGMQKIWNMCADIVKPDCEGKKEMKNGQEVDVNLAEYVSQVAAGVMQNMDDKWAEYCKKTLESVMSDACGGTDSCPKAQTSDLSAMWKDYVVYQVCPEGTNPGGSGCKESESEIVDKSTMCKWAAKRFDKIWTTDIQILSGLTKGKDAFRKNPNVGHSRPDRAVTKLNALYKNIVSSIVDNETLKKCTDGSGAKDFKGSNLKGDKTSENSNRKFFADLDSKVGNMVAQALYDGFVKQYSDRVEEIQTDIADANSKIREGCATSKAEKLKTCQEYAKSLEEGNTESLRRSGFAVKLINDDTECDVEFTREVCLFPFEIGETCPAWIQRCSDSNDVSARCHRTYKL